MPVANIVKHVLTRALLVLIVTGCAAKTTPLVKPGIDADTRAVDAAYCRGWAKAEALKQLDDQGFDDGSTGGALSSWQSSMQRYDNKQSVKSLTRRCLIRRGYRPAS